MARITLRQAAAWCGGSVAEEFENIVFEGANIDSRQIEAGQLFVALEGVRDCIDDGIPVKGYCHWSLLDNFEWQKGFSMTFGLIAVARKSQTRFPKESLTFLGRCFSNQ